MTDEFINELPNTTSISVKDLLVIETDPGGSPITKNILYGDFETLIVDFQNYQIVPSVSSNNLTVAIKDMDGNDATVNKFLKFKVGNTIYTLGAAASITKNAGTNWCNLGSSELAGQIAQVFVYAIGETGASAGLKFGFSRIPYAVVMGEFVNTTTSEKYIAGNWTNFNANDLVTVIGRFNITLGASASYNWSLSSNFVVNRPIYETDWLAWTPTGTGVTKGNGSYSATYYTRGRIVNCNLAFTLGTTSAVSSDTNFTLPVSIATPISATVVLADTGSATYEGWGDIAANAIYTRVKKRNASDYITGSTTLAATVPHVWASTDLIVAKVSGSLT